MPQNTSETQSVQGKPKDSQKLWHLYGNTYDLDSFLEKHPGGSEILKMTQGHQDITPMFESYHAFADYAKLKDDLETYKVGKSEYPLKYSFKQGEFYDVCRERVRKYFGTAKNVNDKVKINNFWYIKCVVLTTIYLFNLFMAFFKANIPTWQASIHAAITGAMVISIGMCVFHDASHWGLFRRNYKKNEIFTKILGAMLMWKSELWMMHHSFRHHTYTGDENLDPDVINYTPFIRKTDRVQARKYIKFPVNILPYITTFILWVFPGQCVGQAFAYWYQWSKKGHLWKMKYPKELMRRTVYENLILFFVIFIHFYKFSFYVSFTYFLGLNIAYALAIIPDHDTNSTHENFDSSKKDWGETQVRNSGNFGNNKFGDLYNHFFGGINYQIEHHLFPSMCGVHLNKIAPIVKETCKEFNIPYVDHTTIMSAYIDFLKGINKLY